MKVSNSLPGRNALWVENMRVHHSLGCLGEATRLACLELRGQVQVLKEGKLKGQAGAEIRLKTGGVCLHPKTNEKP